MIMEEYKNIARQIRDNGYSCILSDGSGSICECGLCPFETECHKGLMEEYKFKTMVDNFIKEFNR